MEPLLVNVQFKNRSPFGLIVFRKRESHRLMLKLEFNSAILDSELEIKIVLYALAAKHDELLIESYIQRSIGTALDGL